MVKPQIQVEQTVGWLVVAKPQLAVVILGIDYRCIFS